ncbi:sphingolipid fatty acid hydroxylase [Ceraceosorus bombacis]|uniref:Sphingolipid fatty acid hydroxylase n=1 Tax=Ceraceosorus bombacis TaxID=401625 RepID=A0A0P1BLJ4_9BASI|nr:sphingolipid fatty acid hydroxylase [Ceraceosorus bombacis]
MSAATSTRSATVAAEKAAVSAAALQGPAQTPATQRLRLISSKQLESHKTASSLWVTYKGNVYDVTEFAPDHPGGDDLILEYAGKDMEEIMDDIDSHSHSDSAYEILKENLVGRLPITQEEHAALAEAENGGADFTGKDDELVITADFQPSDTDLTSDFEKHAFLDLNKPLLVQVWNGTWGKEFYLQQVHSPRHLKESARLFKSPFLEMFTRTPWWVVPLVWAPISAALFQRATSQFAANALKRATATAAAKAAASSAASSAPSSSAFASFRQLLAGSGSAALAAAKQAQINQTQPEILASVAPAALASTLACFATGVVIWTILEYTMHRFLFHVDEMLPDRPFFLMLHFLLHGIHHYLPMDRLRLVMPPLLFAVLEFPFTRLAYALFPVAIANGIISGAFAMYVVYDVMHYSLHHHRLPQYLREMKAYHLAHHYKNYEEGFGVTSKIWDWVFGTEL